MLLLHQAERVSDRLGTLSLSLCSNIMNRGLINSVADELKPTGRY